VYIHAKVKLTIEVLMTDQGGTERFLRWAPTTNKVIKCRTVRGHRFNRAGEPCSERVTVSILSKCQRERILFRVEISALVVMESPGSELFIRTMNVSEVR